MLLRIMLISRIDWSFENARHHEKMARDGIQIADSTDVENKGRSQRRKKKSRKLESDEEESQPPRKKPKTQRRSTTEETEELFIAADCSKN